MKTVFEKTRVVPIASTEELKIDLLSTIIRVPVHMEMASCNIIETF